MISLSNQLVIISMGHKILQKFGLVIWSITLGYSNFSAKTYFVSAILYNSRTNLCCSSSEIWWLEGEVAAEMLESSNETPASTLPSASLASVEEGGEEAVTDI
jgi:hypothetical protein